MYTCIYIYMYTYILTHLVANRVRRCDKIARDLRAHFHNTRVAGWEGLVD